MAEENEAVDLATKAEEDIQARDEKQKPVKIESPIEEAKRISTENRQLLKDMGEERAKLQELAVEIRLAGRAEAGQEVKEKTQEDKDQEAADKMTGRFLKEE